MTNVLQGGIDIRSVWANRLEGYWFWSTLNLCLKASACDEERERRGERSEEANTRRTLCLTSSSFVVPSCAEGEVQPKGEQNKEPERRALSSSLRKWGEADAKASRDATTERARVRASIVGGRSRKWWEWKSEPVLG
jgi:hypothetical protein